MTYIRLENFNYIKSYYRKITTKLLNQLLDIRYNILAINELGLNIFRTDVCFRIH